MSRNSSRPFGVSIVIPTYNETENIRPLTTRLFAALAKDLPHLDCELLFVDDESSGSEQTEKIVLELAKKSSLSEKVFSKTKTSGFPVRIHRRYKTEGRGLSSAVMLGFDKAKFEVVLSMDADLQHEPESVPAVLLPVLDGKVDFTVGCRYMDAGGFGFQWSLFRQILSRGATILAYGLTSSRDPMSGFFCTSKSVLRRGKNINPIGFKIGLEIMARCNCSVQDIPIIFQERVHGESKLSGKQQIEYLYQLSVLYWVRYRGLMIISLVMALYFLFYIAPLTGLTK